MTPDSMSLAVRPVSQVTARPVSWLWPGRLALGKLALLDGDPGLGKSLLALDLCARLSTGRPFPDGTPSPGPANSLVLNAEDGLEDTIRPRLEALGADLDRVFVLDYHAQADHTDAGLLRLPAQLDLLDHVAHRLVEVHGDRRRPMTMAQLLEMMHLDSQVPALAADGLHFGTGFLAPRLQFQDRKLQQQVIQEVVELMAQQVGQIRKIIEPLQDIRLGGAGAHAGYTSLNAALLIWYSAILAEMLRRDSPAILAQRPMLP